METTNQKKYVFLVIFKIIVLLSLIVLLITNSYSWFADKSNPVISTEQIKVTAADGLVIKLTPDSPARTTVSLNQLFSNFEEFELKQVSSADSVNFFKIDFGQGLAMGNPVFVKLENTDTAGMISNGYIDYDFYLETEEYAKHIYFHRDSYLEGIAKDAIRVALTIEGENVTSKTYIFGTEAENGVTDDHTTKAAIKEGEFDYYNIPTDLVSTQYVYSFTSKDGGRSNSDTDEINLDKIIATIPANTQVKVNIKIWLEGGDKDCDNKIASTSIDMLIKFGSSNVLLDAPVLKANKVQKTIEGLTTDMEWTTNKSSLTDWTRVEDTSMTFVGKNTVYVRIAENPGINTCSYITEVNF